MNVIRFCIRNPVTVTVGVLLIVLFGVVALLRLPIQMTPDVTKPEITVETTWRGASPAEVEREIIDEQEEHLKNVQGLEKMRSESSYGQGKVILEFPAGTNMDSALLKTSNRLNQVEEYPFEADEPVISSADLRSSAMAWFILETEANNPVDVETLRDFAEDHIKPRFERVKGVAASNVYGGWDREIRVLVDPGKLAARSITIQEMIRSLDQENRNISAGDFDEGKRSYVVRTIGEYQEPADVEEVVVTVRNGAPVYVRDVAEVSLAYQDPEHVVREMGTPAIAVNAIKESGANLLDTMDGIKEAAAALDADLLKPRGLTFYQVYDETDYVNSSLTLVQQNLVLGSLLAVTVLYLFLRSGGSTLVIGLAIPISIMGTFIMLWLLGRNLNVVSLAGMTFAAGMLVDNAIVVLENIYRHRYEGEGDTDLQKSGWLPLEQVYLHRQMGKTPFQAAYDGTTQVWGAVLASTLTTIAVFVPILFVQEQAGQLFRDIAIAISAGVGLSLITAVTVIPTLSARVFKTRSRDPVPGDGHPQRSFGRLGRALDRMKTQMQRRGLSSYGVARFIYWLCGSVRWRLTVVIGAMALALGLSWFMMPKAEYLPEGNRNLVIGILLPPPGYSIDQFVDMAHVIEAELSPLWNATPGTAEAAQLDGPPILNFFYVARGRQVFMGGRVHEASRVGELIPVFRRATANLPGTISIITQRGLFERGLGEGRNIDLEITGPEVETLVNLGGQVFGQLKGLMPEAQIRPIPSLDLGAPELHVRTKRDRAADVQITNRELGTAVDALVDGAKASDFQYKGDEIDLTLRGRDQFARRVQDIASLPIYTASGRLLTVGDVADIQLVAGPEQINHIERERSIVIQVIPPAQMPLENAMELIESNVLAPIKQSGSLGRLYNLRLSGTADDLTQTYNALKWNFLLALIITYLLMASLFESFVYPFVIILSVPLAAVGGFLGLFLVNTFVTYQALDVLTMLGFIILIGVVVNNAILIVHQSLNFMRMGRGDVSLGDEEGSGSAMPPRQAISEAVRTRVRPIFMSMLTTLFGLLPLVLATGAGSELYRGIGSVVLGGLAVSTVFTLVVVPSLFSLVMDARHKVKEPVRGPELEAAGVGKE